MNYLLDTHVWLALAAAPERIEPSVVEQLSDTENRLYFSAASAWEVSIKYALGKLPLPELPETFIPKRLIRDGINPLPIAFEHVFGVSRLPLLHRDPFDRLLLAQALIEGMTLVTADHQIKAYEVSQLRAW